VRRFTFSSYDPPSPLFFLDYPLTTQHGHYFGYGIELTTIMKSKVQVKKISVILVVGLISVRRFTFSIELNTSAALEHVLRCHLGPRTRKIEIWHPELVKLCHLGPYPLTWRHMI